MNMLNIVHVTHEAVVKVGGIGTVLEGLLTSAEYDRQVGRSLLLCPLFNNDGDVSTRLGPGGEVTYSSIDGMGAGVVEMCDEMAKLGVDAVGADRTEFPDGLPAIISVMRGATDLPIYAEPNAGAAELGESGRVYPEKPATYAERYATISEAGANLVAGGLGTSAPHIAALIRARQVRQRKQAKQQG